MSGQCQFCGCTQNDACAIDFEDPEGRVTTEPCRWVDREQTICSACLDRVNAITLARLVTAEMEGVPPMAITREPADWWAVAMFLQEAIVAHGAHDAATNPTLFQAVLLLQELNELLGRHDRPAMRETLERSFQNVSAEYESVTIDGAHAALGEVTEGGIIIP